MPHKIEQIWCWVATEPDGSEGLPAMQMGDFMAPLIAADEARLKSLDAMAHEIAERTGQRLTLYKFMGERRLIKTIDPAVNH